MAAWWWKDRCVNREPEDEVAPLRGHRLLEHPADIALEAWGPTRAECLAEAVRALVGSFADLSATTASDSLAVTLEPADDEDLLLRLLDEVIYLLDVFGRVPVDAEVEDAEDGGLIVHFATSPGSEVQLLGAVPKGVSLHQLRFGYGAGRWRCHATVDV